MEVGETEAEEELDFDENLKPIEKSPYASGSNTPRINGNPRKNAFSTEGLEEWQIDQMMEEVFGESESGFEAAGLSKKSRTPTDSEGEIGTARKNSAPSSVVLRPPDPIHSAQKG